MSRLVKRFRHEPFEVTAGGETLYICGCGLSGNLPYCDGSHELTTDEDPTRLYWYDGNIERHETTAEFPDIRSDIPSA